MARSGPNAASAKNDRYRPKAVIVLWFDRINIIRLDDFLCSRSGYTYPVFASVRIKHEGFSGTAIGKFLANGRVPRGLAEGSGGWVSSLGNSVIAGNE